MDTAATRELLGNALADIAPEADLGAVGDGEDLRRALDLDSMDFLNVMVSLHEQTGVAIPEADYPKLFTIAGIAAYLP